MTQKITNLLDELGIAYRIEEHEPVFTVEEALAIHGDTTVKNLLLKEEKGENFVFIIMSGPTRLDTKSLAAHTGLKKLQFAKSEALMDVLDVEPGSVSLFSLVGKDHSKMAVVIDAHILHDKEIGFHPNKNTSSIFIKGSAVPSFLKGINVHFSVMDI